MVQLGPDVWSPRGVKILGTLVGTDASSRPRSTHGGRTRGRCGRPCLGFLISNVDGRPFCSVPVLDATKSGGTVCPRPRPGHDGNHGGVARRSARRRGAEDVGSEDRDYAHVHGRIRYAVCDPHVSYSVLGLVGRCAPHDFLTTSRGGERHRHTIGRGTCGMLGRAPGCSQ